MKKAIIIEKVGDCKSCPFVREDQYGNEEAGGYVAHCTKSNRLICDFGYFDTNHRTTCYEDQIRALFDIPTWCPLEDW